jgi:multisubunit Na+/H+ antiporter MnhC subunit
MQRMQRTRVGLGTLVGKRKKRWQHAKTSFSLLVHASATTFSHIPLLSLPSTTSYRSLISSALHFTRRAHQSIFSFRLSSLGSTPSSIYLQQHTTSHAPPICHMVEEDTVVAPVAASAILTAILMGMSPNIALHLSTGVPVPQMSTNSAFPTSHTTYSLSGIH